MISVGIQKGLGILKSTSRVLPNVLYSYSYLQQQWRDSWGQGGSVPPEIFTRKFLLTYWERSGKEKMENNRRKIVKEKVEN